MDLHALAYSVIAVLIALALWDLVFAALIAPTAAPASGA